VLRDAEPVRHLGHREQSVLLGALALDIGPRRMEANPRLGLGGLQLAYEVGQFISRCRADEDLQVRTGACLLGSLM
jgi:hypothetical protein